MEKNKTIGFLVMWEGDICCDEDETGCDAELQNIYSQPIRTLKEAKEFVTNHLYNFKDVEIVKVISR